MSESAPRSDLPRAYGRSRLVVLPIDPYHAHAYWEVTLEDRIALNELWSAGPEAERTWVLRFHDITQVEFDGTNAHHRFDVPVFASARSRYVDFWSPGRSYLVELGVLTGGAFFPACRSKPLHLPPAPPPGRGEQAVPPEHGEQAERGEQAECGEQAQPEPLHEPLGAQQTRATATLAGAIGGLVSAETRPLLAIDREASRAATPSGAPPPESASSAAVAESRLPAVSMSVSLSEPPGRLSSGGARA